MFAIEKSNVNLLLVHVINHPPAFYLYGTAHLASSLCCSCKLYMYPPPKISNKP